MAKTSTDARDKTFGIRSARDMIAKLRWERSLLGQHIGQPEEGYLAINMAWTAFHTLD